jgi:SAM-dependent methyltransferase
MKVNIEPAVASYLRSVGIGGYQEHGVFWERLREEHGAIAEPVARAIAARERGEDVDVYRLKNATLALSIDVTAQYYNQMYREFLTWFCRARLAAPKSLLDVGCDNGILTCFYATRFPAAEVIGIDKCDEGIACARELASRLKLPNARFEAHDLRKLDGAFPEQSVDLVVSTAVFHEVVRFPEDFPDGGPLVTSMKPEETDCMRILGALAGFLRRGTGTLLSAERCADAETVTWWTRLLNQAGLDVDADRSLVLGYDNVYGERETLPLVLATRRRHPMASSGPEVAVDGRVTP